MKILAIETSCDETSVAIVGNGKNVLANIVASQANLHAKYGGVVPEVAARMQVTAIIPVLKEALRVAQIDWADIDAVAVANGPGLVGSLVVGVETAKILALTKNKPLIDINHLAGHIYANWLEQETPSFPLLALLVSGGHTMIIYMKNHFEFEVLGKTRDDAAGEAFDKVAALLSLPYPGGPQISIAAQKGNENKFKFPVIDLTPKPVRNEEGFLVSPPPSLDFSFSGLKTAVLDVVKKEKKLTEKQIFDISASFQKALVDTLVQNSRRAIRAYKPKSFLLSGGVAANITLRAALKEMTEEEKVSFSMPHLQYCTDNAAMIGAAAHFKKTGAKNIKNVTATPIKGFFNT